MTRFADLCPDLLALGYSVRFRANGGSMHPTIRDGESITVQPVPAEEVEVGDILLYRKSHRLVAHRLRSRESDHEDTFVFCGDASTCRPEVVNEPQILGKVISIERSISSTLRTYAFMLKRWLLITLLLFLPVLKLDAADSTSKLPVTQYQQVMRDMPLYFIANNGQLDTKVKYYVRGKEHAAFFTNEGVYFSKASSGKFILLVPENANSLEITAEAQMRARINYIIGNDPNKWRSNIPTYQTVVYSSVYPGIDMKFHGEDALQYDLIIHPGADPSKIKMSLKGIDGLKIMDTGDLSIQVGSKSMLHERPHLYQEIEGKKKEITGRFKILKPASADRFTYGFEVGTYDAKLPLIIDPTIEYSSMIGGSNNDRAYAMTTDQQGRLFATGDTRSSPFDATSGAYDETFDSGRDGWVAKFDTNLNGSFSLVYCTYFGGNNSDAGNGIAIDSSANAYVTGTTASPDFPTFGGPFDSTYNNGDDVFVFKLNATGSALVYSSYLGGAQSDEGHQIALDSSNDAYVTGLTNSTDFPTTAGAFDKTTNGNTDIFVTKFNSTGTALLYSTYIGGSNSENAIGIVVGFGTNDSGVAYVTGSTSSTNYPTTTNAYDTSSNGQNDVVVIKLNPDPDDPGGTADPHDSDDLLYSTYIGGSGQDYGGGNPIDIGNDSAGAANGISVNSSGVLCVAGQTSSTNWPTTAGGYDNTLNSNNQEDAFIMEFNPSLSGLNGLLYSTYLGGNNKEAGFDAIWTNFGTCCVIGYTQSDNFPTHLPLFLNGTTQGAPLKYDGSVKLAQRDGFIVSINFDQDDPAGSADPNDPDDLIFSSFIGGDQQDSAFAGAAAGQGTVCCLAGVTFKDPTKPFPTTSGNEYPSGSTKVAYQQGNDGNDDGFVCCIRGAATAVELISFNATIYGNRTLLEWETGYESNNLGFHIYRQENGQRKQLTESILAGSALTVKGESPQAGFSYAFWDDLPKKNGRIEYWLEDIDLNGTRTLHGPYFPQNAQGPPPKRNRAILLSKLGRGTPRFSSGILEIDPEMAAKNFGIVGYAEQTEAQIVQAGATSSALATQWDIASKPGAKILVRQRGWYRVTQPELIAAGINPLLDPRYLQLYAGGVQLPILVQGEKDGHFDAADSIEFYGAGVDTPSTDTKVYWLINGSTRGKRISVTKPANQPVSTAASFPFTVERKDRTINFGALLNGDAENWFGAIVTSTPLQQSLTLQKVHVSPPGNALVEVSIQGVTDVVDESSDHRIQVLVNGNYAGEMSFDGRELKTQSFSIPQAFLAEGQNNVTLTELRASTDVSLVNFIRITYWHTFDAESNLLPISTPGKQKITVKGFSNSFIRVADITSPDSPQELIGTIQQQGSGFAITVNIPLAGQRTLLAFSNDRIAAASVKANQPSNWNKANVNGEVTMIVHGDFINPLSNLQAFRISQGHSVALVNVEDVYDEFSFGMKSPAALKDFLNRARTSWKTPPAFVLLGGDATGDPKNYLGFGDFDYIPTKLVDTASLETSSDNWFVDFNGDDLPEMAIGRLPVRTADQAALLVSKITGYEEGPVAGWRNEVILAADNNQLFDFEGATASLEGLLPSNLTVTKVLLGQTDTATARDTLIGGIDAGKLLVNYYGHGSVQIWADERLLKLSDADALTNADRLPFFNIMTCLNGWFHDPNTESLAEGLLNAPNGGAVGVWASSGFTATEVQAVLGRELVKSLFDGQHLTIGEATVKAKQAITNPDVLRTWILFGDPVTRFQ